MISSSGIMMYYSAMADSNGNDSIMIVLIAVLILAILHFGSIISIMIVL